MVVKFHTLGRFVLVRDGQPVPRAEWRTHRAPTLCKVLLTYRGQRLHKEQLQDWIWPEVSAEAAARNLRVALSELRRVLEPGRRARDESSFIESSGDSVELVTDGLWLDTVQLLAAAEIDPSAPNAVLDLQAAANLYQGVYLPDDLYADWAAVERERLALVRESVLLKLAHAHALNAQVAAALRICRHMLAENPTSEVFAEHAVRYAAELGDLSQALSIYQEFCAALEQQLQLRPSPRLAELVAQIREAPRHEETPRPGEIRPVVERSQPSVAKTIVFAEGKQVEATLRRSQELMSDVRLALMRVQRTRKLLAESAMEARLSARDRLPGE